MARKQTAHKEQQKSAAAGVTDDPATYQMLSVKSIIPTPDNPRTLNTATPKWIQLVESVKASGVRIPVHVRVHPQIRGCYDLRDGMRRHAAAQEAGIFEIPAIVHENMSDEEAMKLTFLAGHGDEDLTPLEKGKAVAILMEKYSGDIRAVASILGWSENKIATHARIHEHLSKNWRKELADNTSEYQFFTAGHLALIARLPQAIQDDLIEDYSICPPDISVDLLESNIAKKLGFLAKAPWDLDDAALAPKAGSCTACTKRAAREAILFAVDGDTEAVKKDDRCLDDDCFKNKMHAHLSRALAKLKKENEKAVLLVDEGKHYDRHARGEAAKLGDYTLKDNYQIVKKGADGAIPALIANGKEAGAVKWVKPKADAGRVQGSGNRGQEPKPQKTLKQRRDDLNCRRWAQVIDEFRQKIVESPATRLRKEITITDLAAIAIVYGVSRDHATRSQCDYQHESFDGYREVIELGEREIFEAVWFHIAGPIADSLRYFGSSKSEFPQSIIEHAKQVATLFVDFDLDSSFRDICERKGFTEPKSWAALEKANGKGKKAKGKTGKAAAIADDDEDEGAEGAEEEE